MGIKMTAAYSNERFGQIHRKSKNSTSLRANDLLFDIMNKYFHRVTIYRKTTVL